ncbi:MAG: HEPN domain-containing protein [Oscillospiraceae bacterium]|nr:HEPN domain-containing protein [Oscillospiraceae bacterium]
MLDREIRALVEFRLEQARDCLQSAEVSAEAELYKDAANRSYYCIFHCIRAILALDKIDSKKHSGIISAFRQRYIKTGKFNSVFSDIIGDAFEVRNSSDYEDFYIISRMDVNHQIENAKIFIKAVGEYIEQISSNSQK